MKTDARVRYTRMRIREAFLNCLETKPVSKITVKEICDMAEINRATFYKHYADPFELLQKLEEEALAELGQNIQACRQGTSQGLLLTILNSMKNTENSYTLLTSPNGDSGFAARIADIFYKEFQPRMAKELPGCSDDEKNAAFLFVSGGCGHLISEWIKNGMPSSTEQVADGLNKMCTAFVKAYGQ